MIWLVYHRFAHEEIKRLRGNLLCAEAHQLVKELRAWLR